MPFVREQSGGTGTPNQINISTTVEHKNNVNVTQGTTTLKIVLTSNGDDSYSASISPATINRANSDVVKFVFNRPTVTVVE